MSKRHVENAKGVKLNTKIFFYQAIENIKTLKIEGIGYIVEGHQEKYTTVIMDIKVENILYFKYFLN